MPGVDRRLWTLLAIDEEVLPDDRDFEFRVPQAHRLIVRDGDRRHELRPGDELNLPEGRLKYLRLTSWMGYRIDYDWTRPWLLATVIVGLLGLFGHFLTRFGWIGRRTGSAAPVSRRFEGLPGDCAHRL